MTPASEPDGRASACLSEYQNCCDHFGSYESDHLPGPEDFVRQYFPERAAPESHPSLVKACRDSFEEAKAKRRCLASRYRLEGDKAVAKGGYGEVWKALDSKTNRSVAVKLLYHLDGHEREVLERLSCNHTHIVALTDRGHFSGRRHDVLGAGGFSYLVFEWVEGGTLEGVRIRDPESEGRAVRWAIDLCSAVGFLHSKGIRHRDLKPANVLVTAEVPPQVKLADFSIAKLPDAGTGAGKTAAGSPIGTPDYRPPELDGGHHSGVDYTGVDVWGLGAVLYALISGHSPLVSRDPLLRDHQGEAPGFRSSPASEPLKGACLRCLRKDPGHRYQSASEIREALEGLTLKTPHGRSAWALLAVALSSVCVVIAALLLIYAPWGQGRRDLATQPDPTQQGNTRPGDVQAKDQRPLTAPEGPAPRALTLIVKVQFKYRIADGGDKDPAVNVIGRLYDPGGKPVVEVGLASEVQNRLVKPPNVIDSEVAVVAPERRVRLADLQSGRYSVDIEQTDPRGNNPHMRCRYQVEVIDGDGVTHILLGFDDRRHTWNGTDLKPPCYDLEHNPGAGPRHPTHKTRPVTLTAP